MEKVTLFLTALALASPAFGQSAPTQANSADAVRAEVAEIMAATEVRATAPLVPTAETPLAIEDEEFLAGFRARLRYNADRSLESARLTFTTGDFYDLDPSSSDTFPISSLQSADKLSLSREGLGWSLGQTRLSVHAAFLHGATGDPNSAAPLPVAVDGLDLTPAASAPRQFVFTFQAEIVF